MHLKEVRVDRTRFGRSYPFNVAAVNTVDRLELGRSVTILVGENGTGKSTLLEAIAAAAGSVVVGGSGTIQSRLGDCLQLVWGRKTRKGFFLGADDFINFSRKIDELRSEIQTRLEELDEEYQGRSEYALKLARMPLLGQLTELENTYGGSLGEMSHGESFLHLFQRRLVPGGLYLLDEPETPLSPVKQLALIALIVDMARENCQFIIATHSPLLMAIPDAQIYSFDELPPRVVGYEELEHVQMTRDFLNDPQSFLRHL